MALTTRDGGFASFVILIIKFSVSNIFTPLSSIVKYNVTVIPA